MAKPPNAVCRQCGKSYVARLYAVREGRAKYCSVPCRRAGVGPPTWRTAPADRAKKLRANGLINMRLRRGAIKRPDSCEACGAEKRLDAHHPDYDKPDEAVWLCRSCHAKEHQ